MLVSAVALSVSRITVSPVIAVVRTRAIRSIAVGASPVVVVWAIVSAFLMLPVVRPAFIVAFRSFVTLVIRFSFTFLVGLLPFDTWYHFPGA